ncbi:hypothetical protein ACWGRV_27105 [Streptomyces sp. NPDC055663]
MGRQIQLSDQGHLRRPALGTVLEDSGFQHSVLADFCLAVEGRADTLLDLALEKIRAVGLFRERGWQAS